MALRPVAFSAQPTQTELRLSKAAVVKTMPCIPMISHWIRAQVNQTANHFIQKDFFCLDIVLHLKNSIPSSASESASTRP